MRILQVLHFFLPRHSAGTEVYTDSIARALAERGHDVHLFFTEKVLSRPNYQVLRREHHGLPCHVLVNNLLYESFEETFVNPSVEQRFAEVLDQVRPDVVHLQHLMLLSLRLPALAAERGIPVAMTLHDFWLFCARFGQLLEHGETICRGPKPGKCAQCIADFKFAQTPLQKRVIHAIRWTREAAGFDLAPVVDLWRGSRLFSAAKLLRRSKERPESQPQPELEAHFQDREHEVSELLHHVDLFLAPSRTVRDRSVAFGLPAAKVRVLPLGIQEVRGVERHVPAEGRLTFGFIGTLSPHKGVHVAIEAMRFLKGHADLVVFGRRDYYPRYAASLQEMAEGQPVRFAGPVPRRDIGKAFSQIDALVMPSVWLENFPIIIQEARAARVPVIASDLGGMREAVRDGVDGVLFKAGDAKALARALASLVRHPERLAEMAENAEPPLTLAVHADRVEEHLERLVAAAQA